MILVLILVGVVVVAVCCSDADADDSDNAVISTSSSGVIRCKSLLWFLLVLVLFSATCTGNCSPPLFKWLKYPARILIQHFELIHDDG